MNEKRKSVIEKILDAIQSGDIGEDGKIPSERDLSNYLDQNRTVVREALIYLEAMGVIEIRERQGIFLSTKNEDEAKQQFLKSRQWPADRVSRAIELRQLVDPAATALAAIRRTKKDMVKLESCLKNMEQLLQGSSDEASKAGAYWNTVYHSMIVASTGNSYLTKIYEGIIEGIENAMYLMRAGTKPFDGGGRIVAFEEHKKIYEAIYAQDRMEAELLAEEHLSHTLDAITRLGLMSPASNLYKLNTAGIRRFKDQLYEGRKSVKNEI